MTDLLIPGLLTTVCTFALWKKESAYDLLVEGAAEGLVLLKSIIPTLVILMTGISMLRASGAFDTMGHILAPVFSFFGIPTETAVLVLIRPISGSAALAVGAELMGQYGVDSEIGRTVAIMLGSTETTFYTVSVYFAAAGIKKTRYAIPAALIADFVGFLTASWTTRLLF